VAQANGLAIRGNIVIQTTGLNKPINMPRVDVTTDSSGVTITGNIAHSIPSKAGWTGGEQPDRVERLQDRGQPREHASGSSVVLDVDGGTDSPDDGTQTPAPTTPTTPTTPSADLAALATPQSPAFYAELARKFAMTLKTGIGDAGDNVVLVTANGVARGDNVLAGLRGGTSSISPARGSAEPGLAVFDGSGAATVDSLADLRALVARSADVTSRSGGGGIEVLRIVQDGSVHEIRLDGYDHLL
jgi:hypothetical protein